MTRPRTVNRALALSMLLPLGGCFAAAHKSSPVEFGAGVRVAPALWDVGENGVTAHPAAGYTYLSFDGGHDALWEFGGQLRKPMGDEASPFWIGGEATLSHLRTSVDDSSFSGSTNGFSLTALIGRPVGDANRWNPNLFGGFGISNYGNAGWNIRVGIDLQPTFIWEN